MPRRHTVEAFFTLRNEVLTRGRRRRNNPKSTDSTLSIDFSTAWTPAAVALPSCRETGFGPDPEPRDPPGRSDRKCLLHIGRPRVLRRTALPRPDTSPRRTAPAAAPGRLRPHPRPTP